MGALEIYGWMCALVGSVLAVPQLYKLLRTRTSAGLSLLMWQLNVSVNASWTTHGLIFGYWNMIVPNALLGMCGVLILVMIIKDRQLNPVTVFAVPIAIFAALSGVDLWVSTVLFGVMISIPQLVGAFAQFRDLLRLHDIRGLSFPYLVHSVVVNVMWLIWGLWASDAPIILAASTMGIMVSINTVWWVLRHKGIVRPRGPQPADGLVRAS